MLKKEAFERFNKEISSSSVLNVNLEDERRLELEYFYCKNCNLILDIKCVFLTIAAVLFKTGAK